MPLPVSAAQLALDGAGYKLGAGADANKPVQLFHQALSLRERIAKGEELLKQLHAELRAIEDDQLPSAMDESGLSELKADGWGVAVDQVVTGSISEAQAAPACEWLRRNGHAGLVQHTFVINFKAKGDAAAVALRKALDAKRLDYKEKEVVHHMSLKAWAREQIQRGTTLPYDLLGLWVGRRAVIKPLKEK